MHPDWKDESWQPFEGAVRTERGERMVTIAGAPYLLAAQRPYNGACELYLSSGTYDRNGEQVGASVEFPICIGPLVGRDWLELGPEWCIGSLLSYIESTLPTEKAGIAWSLDSLEDA